LIGAIPSPWLRRKVLQLCERGRPVRIMYLPTVDSETSIPSMSSYRGCAEHPTAGFLCPIRRSKTRISRSTRGRPPRVRDRNCQIRRESLADAKDLRLNDDDRVQYRREQKLEPDEDEPINISESDSYRDLRLRMISCWRNA
jgi:hypothetical protein